ncbi:MAG TPA: RNA 2',3'-cyclic phosphodiesterase [Gammaproteobacteria bacterium]|nr:RNA 2',3'-cyclic phosphodiesterase [Gammaproteobacteria bacterium]
MPQRSPLSTHETQPAGARLFFALCPEQGGGDSIYKATRNAVQASGGRPTSRENLHLTLAFLGNVAPDLEARVAALATDTAAEVAAAPFSFDLDEIGYWPGSQVLWYGCRQTPETLRGLAMQLRRRLQAAQLPPKADKFVPHVTLARWVKNPGPLPAAVRIPWEVREFVLMRSETLAAGVRYTPLARCTLGRQASLL